MQVSKIHQKSYKLLPNQTFSSCKMRFVDNFLNNETIILFNQHLGFVLGYIPHAISQDNNI